MPRTQTRSTALMKIEQLATAPAVQALVEKWRAANFTVRQLECNPFDLTCVWVEGQLEFADGTTEECNGAIPSVQDLAEQVKLKNSTALRAILELELGADLRRLEKQVSRARSNSALLREAQREACWQRIKGELQVVFKTYGDNEAALVIERLTILANELVVQDVLET